MASVITAQEAASLIRDGQTLCVGGFVGLGTPDEILAAIEARFIETGHPSQLSVMNCAGCGDKKERGMNRFGHLGMVRLLLEHGASRTALDEAGMNPASRADRHGMREAVNLLETPPPRR